MAAKNTYERGAFHPSKRRAKRPANSKVFLIVTACVLIAAIAVSAILIIGNSQETMRIIDFGTILKGVSVGGIDISGMTRAQAMEATANLEPALLGTVNISLDVNGQKLDYTAGDFGVTTDYQDIMAEALSLGHTGTFDKRVEAAEDALEHGVQYGIKLVMDESVLRTGLAELKTKLDKAPMDAAATFMPWGYTLNADGTATAYQPDLQRLIEDSADLKALTYPDNLVRNKKEDMPPKIRYQFYKDDHFEENYTPAAANIAHFFYTQEQTGLIADTDAIYDELMGQIRSDEFSTITVPVQVTEPAVRLDQVKQQTQLITSWTSSYGAGSHSKYDRVWNVAKISGMICGQILQPGVQWSINDTAGPRKTELGWRKASGIVDGGYVDQPGGGVCQVSSTLYNAAIRCGLTKDNIVSKHHSIISGYIQLGMDATISTPSPDLKLTNPYATPLYVVSYMNPETKSVTVEIYGVPPTDAATGEAVVYDFDSADMGPYGAAPIEEYFFNQPALPDGTPIEPGGEKRYAEMQDGKKIQTYRHFKKLNGEEYKPAEEFDNVTIKPINGKIYCNHPDQSLAPPATNAPPAQ
jgi:hypothetical protein